nr:MAG TPA: hypothetical protein [Caudoviricetes sp.]
MVIYVILYADKVTGKDGNFSYLVNAVHTAYFTKESAEAHAGEYEEDDRVVEVHPIDIDLFCGIPWERDIYIMACYTQDFQFDGRKSKLFVTASSPNSETLVSYMAFLAHLNDQNGWKIVDSYPMQRKMVFKNDDFSLQIRLCCVHLPHDIADRVRYVEE